jgi:hypothetical protein
MDMVSHLQRPFLKPQAPSYQAAFSVLVVDFKRLCEFVEPTDANLRVYSHRTFELLLRACTEWESMCKDCLIEVGHSASPRGMTVNDYRDLEPILHLEAAEVGLSMWQPAPVYVRPYEAWSESRPPLRWYAEYNSVKHNRNSGFANASFSNVSLALSALFVLHVRLGIIQVVAGTTERQVGDATETWYPNSIFSIRLPRLKPPERPAV